MAAAPRELPGAWNFRDVADGVDALRPGKLFRSSELSRLDDGGRDTLRRLGITDVVDLRAAREVERRGPGRVPDGVDVHLRHFPDLSDQEDDGADGAAPHESAFQQLLADSGTDGSTESLNETAAQHMLNEYRQFPTRNGAQRAVRHVITLLAGGRPVLAHCFAGKDRTGFVVATVLEAIGIDRDTIVADYLRSNEAVPQLRERIMQMISERADTDVTPEVVTLTKARLSEGILGVREEYLANARKTIDEEFGSLENYLRDAGVTVTDLDGLRGALLG